MKRIGFPGNLLAGLSCLGLMLQATQMSAGTPGPINTLSPSVVGDHQPLISDIELDTTGQLWGIVVDVQGVPLANVEVILSQRDRDLVVVRTDMPGRFSFGPLKGGVYQLKAGEQVRLVRAWTAGAAPPVAQRMALLVVGGDVARGQMPAEEFFASDAVVSVGLLGAMIGLPIALHNNGGQHRPASP